METANQLVSLIGGRGDLSLHGITGCLSEVLLWEGRDPRRTWIVGKSTVRTGPQAGYRGRG